MDNNSCLAFVKSRSLRWSGEEPVEDVRKWENECWYLLKKIISDAMFSSLSQWILAFICFETIIRYVCCTYMYEGGYFQPTPSSHQDFCLLPFFFCFCFCFAIVDHYCIVKEIFSRSSAVYPALFLAGRSANLGVLMSLCMCISGILCVCLC